MKYSFQKHELVPTFGDFKVYLWFQTPNGSIFTSKATSGLLTLKFWFPWTEENNFSPYFPFSCHWGVDHTSHFWHHPSTSQAEIVVKNDGPTSIFEHNPQRFRSWNWRETLVWSAHDASVWSWQIRIVLSQNFSWSPLVMTLNPRSIPKIFNL